MNEFDDDADESSLLCHASPGELINDIGMDRWQLVQQLLLLSPLD